MNIPSLPCNAYFEVLYGVFDRATSLGMSPALRHKLEPAQIRNGLKLARDDKVLIRLKQPCRTRRQHNLALPSFLALVE
jgi:hypothetical protein